MTKRSLALWIETASWSFVLLGALLPLVFHTPFFAPYRDARGLRAKRQ